MIYSKVPIMGEFATAVQRIRVSLHVGYVYYVPLESEKALRLIQNICRIDENFRRKKPRILPKQVSPGTVFRIIVQE